LTGRLFHALTRPVRFDYLLPLIRDPGSTVVLDVGCGNHSASVTKKYLPGSVYHGLDIDEHYNNDARDAECMDRFFRLDLDASDLGGIDEGSYDLIIFSHVIEHLHDGLAVLAALAGKLKPGGIIYVETPHPRSRRLPSMRGSLNFHDDASHVRVYPVPEVVGTLEGCGCSILRAGTRRSLKRIALTPLHCLNSIVRDGYVAGSAFWDLLGFASVVVARRSTDR
jgi:SAM-dependent methyltransferase